MTEVSLFSVLTVATVLTLMVSLSLFFYRLEMKYKELWISLGRPGQKTFWIGFSWKLFRFIFFQGDSRQYNLEIRTYVIVVRVLCVLLFAIISVRILERF